MTVSTTSRKVTYVGNDATVNWDFSFPVLDASHLVVQVFSSVTGTVQVISSANYTLTLNEDNTGSINYSVGGTPLTTTDTIIITRVVPLLQELDINNQDGFFPELVEEQLDLLTMMVQQVDASGDSVISAPISDPDLINLELPAAAERASKYLFFDSGGNVGVTGTAPSVQYQGAFDTANAPTTRLGGSALQEGDLYFNTDTNRLKVYDGAAWQTGVDASSSIDIVGMTALAGAIAAGDFLPIYDLSGVANRKATPQEVVNFLGLVATVTGIDVTGDTIPYFDSGLSAMVRVTFTDFMEAINGLTVDATPAAATDYVMTYDASASTVKKVLLEDLAPGGLTSVGPQTVSGAQTFNWAIPAGVKKIWVTGYGVSSSGSGTATLRIGTASTPEVTGYVSRVDESSSSSISSTTSLLLQRANSAADTFDFEATLTHLGGNKWSVTNVVTSNERRNAVGGGRITLSGALDIVQLRVTSGTFDGGTVDVMYL